MELDQVSAADRLQTGDGSLERKAVGMGRAIEGGDQRIYAADRRVVIVLPDRGDGLDATLVDFGLREQRLPDDIGDQREEVLEVLGQAIAGDREGVARRRHAQ